jgi:hypothetical protein
MASVTRRQVLSFRVRAQQLDRESGTLADTAILDIGVQETGPDGGLWALAIRGVDVGKLREDSLSTVWTIRGAPHRYRRRDLASIAAATEPFSDADAGKRIFDATKPLKAAGIGNIEALDAVAAAMRSVVTRPTVKGEVSTAVTKLMDKPYLRFCRACDATHLYEMPFRLAALRAGLELQPGTSPPVLQRIPKFRVAAKVPDRFDVVRAYLRLLGPATPKLVADYLDAPVKDVEARWPEDAAEVSLGKERRWVLAEDAGAVQAAPVRLTRLLGPFDLYLQGKDRSLLVDSAAHAKALWPALGRPGGILLDGDIVGMWRPRQSGKKFAVQVTLWHKETPTLRRALTEQAERLAAFRGVDLGGVTVAS